MKEREVQDVVRRIGIQLRNDRFVVCHEIIKELEEAWKNRHDPPTAIAELDVSRRLVELLEREGYIYISDLEDIDVDRWNLVGLGVTYKRELKIALENVKEQRERAVRKEKAERGVPPEPLLYKGPTEKELEYTTQRRRSLRRSRRGSSTLNT